MRLAVLGIVFYTISQSGIKSTFRLKNVMCVLLFDKTLDYLSHLCELLGVVDVADVAAAVLQNA
jgi:hypothetical protein